MENTNNTQIDRAFIQKWYLETVMKEEVNVFNVKFMMRKHSHLLTSFEMKRLKRLINDSYKSHEELFDEHGFMRDGVLSRLMKRYQD